MREIVIIIIGVITVLEVVNIGISRTRIVKQGWTNREKRREYECGYEGKKREEKKYHIRYYKIGLMYLIFDIEITMLYNIMNEQEQSIKSIVNITVIIVVIIIGTIYEIKRVKI